jgi:hypothetical protein
MELRDNLQEKFDVTQIEVSNQPEVIPHSMTMAIFRSFILKKLYCEWSRYCQIKQPNILREAKNFVKENINKYIFNRNLGALWNTRSFVETILTDKHIRAWNTFIETGCDYLVCFEDDAIFSDDSDERLGDLMDALSNKGLKHLVYVDLAGGCELADLRISFLETRRGDGFRYYSKPLTNTTCAYSLSKPLVSLFLLHLIRRPWLRLITIDWMINKLFMLIVKNKVECFCAHADPTIFKHGSVVGHYGSALRDRVDGLIQTQ